MSNKLKLLGMIVIGLALFGCDDGEEVTDSGAFDANVAHDAATDAAPTGDATMDGATTDAALDATVGDATAGDGAAGDGGDGGGAFSASVMLTSAQEVPVCEAAGASATGMGTISVDEAGTTIRVMTLTYSGLSGPVTAAHIHSGAPGVAGPPIFPFTDLTSPINEMFTAADYPSPVPAGAPADFAAFVAAMRAGDTYVNLHTAACASGEIRDQIE